MGKKVIFLSGSGVIKALSHLGNYYSGLQNQFYNCTMHVNLDFHTIQSGASIFWSHWTKQVSTNQKSAFFSEISFRRQIPPDTLRCRMPNLFHFVYQKHQLVAKIGRNPKAGGRSRCGIRASTLQGSLLLATESVARHGWPWFGQSCVIQILLPSAGPRKRCM